jgi:hypothetical protein
MRTIHLLLILAALTCLAVVAASQQQPPDAGTFILSLYNPRIMDSRYF